VAMRSNGSITAWGNNTVFQTNTPSGNSYYYIAAGFSCSFALGDFEITHTEDDETADYVPALKVYPNPAVSGSALKFTLNAKVPASTTISIFNVKGQRVNTLQIEPDSEGRIWNMLDMNNQPCAPGVYFYGLTSGALRQTGKFMIMK
jgi:hypothetical protein